MKRTARNLIKNIKDENGVFDVSTFPEGVLMSEQEKEKELKRVIDICESRKRDLSLTMSKVTELNNKDLACIVNGLVVPSIDILSLCGLLLSAVKELDNEVIALRGYNDQLEAENARLKTSGLMIREKVGG